jgi:hypothetical protein
VQLREITTAGVITAGANTSAVDAPQFYFHERG